MDRRSFLTHLLGGSAIAALTAVGLWVPSTKKIFLPLAENPLGRARVQPPTPDELRQLNESLFDHLAGRDPVKIQMAEDAINDWTRRRMRETGFARHILPPLALTNNELDRALPPAGQPNFFIGNWTVTNRVLVPEGPQYYFTGLENLRK